MTRPLSLNLRPRRASAPANSDKPQMEPHKPQANGTASQTPQETSKGGDSSKPSKYRIEHTRAKSDVTEASRVRNEIRSHIRNDWTFPLPEDFPPLRVESNSQYLERQYDLTSPSASPLISPFSLQDTVPLEDADSAPLPPAALDYKSAYRFDSPTAVRVSINDRKRKLWNYLRDEMTINEGLSRFEAQRDAWTGSVHVTRPKHGQLSHRQVMRKKAKMSKSIDGEAEESKRDSWLSLNGINVLNGIKNRDSKESAGSSAKENEVEENNDTDEEDSSESEDDYIPAQTPVAPPLLPHDHPIKLQITPRMYPSIYSKVVCQGTTPNIPIPLKDLISACVDGWQREGSWPPKPTPPEPLLGRKKGTRKLSDGMASMPGFSAVGRGVRRVMRIVGGGEAGESKPM